VRHDIAGDAACFGDVGREVVGRVRGDLGRAHLVDIGIAEQIPSEITIARARPEEREERRYLGVALELVLAELLHPAFELEAFLDQAGWDLGVGGERARRLGLRVGEEDEEGSGLEGLQVGNVELTEGVLLLEARVERVGLGDEAINGERGERGGADVEARDEEIGRGDGVEA
jgi:hypothetical protein